LPKAITAGKSNRAMVFRSGIFSTIFRIEERVSNVSFQYRRIKIQKINDAIL